MLKDAEIKSEEVVANHEEMKYDLISAECPFCKKENTAEIHAGIHVQNLNSCSHYEYLKDPSTPAEKWVFVFNETPFWVG